MRRRTRNVLNCPECGKPVQQFALLILMYRPGVGGYQAIDRYCYYCGFKAIRRLHGLEPLHAS